MSRKFKIIIIFLIDSVLITLANLFSYVYMSPFVTMVKSTLVMALILQLFLYWVIGGFFHVFSRINRFTSLKELVSIFIVMVISCVLELLYFSLTKDLYSRRHVFLTYLLGTFLICASRVTWRILIEQFNGKNQDRKKQKNTLVVGAGAGGGILVNTLNNSKTNDELRIVGFVDDDINKKNTFFMGQRVRGTTKELPQLIEDFNVEVVTIAIPSLSPRETERIFDIVNPLGVTVNSMPSIEEIVNGDVKAGKLRKIEVVDLLGRDEVELDMDALSNQLTGKVIMVTGAGGSIGSEICRQVIKFNPKCLLLVGHGENSIYLIEKELRTKHLNRSSNIVPIIADVQDRERIFEIVKEHNPDIIYHAAAHKHVPLMEYNPKEAVKNNIFGTKNVAEAAKEFGVSSFVMVSTDKATNPPNVMGATKRIAEMIVTGLNEKGKTKFSAVRFGNVLGSRGSVVPLFQEQIEKGGPITVTDFEMTRYFMTIPEASRLVIQAGALANGGEIFILDMGKPVKIYDLAKKMVKLNGYSEEDIPIIEVGIRPGEKLYEELMVDKEKAREQVYDKIFVGNISGFEIGDIKEFVEHLSKGDKELSKEIVAFANESVKEGV